MSDERRIRPQAVRRGHHTPGTWLDIYETDSSDGVVRVLLDGELDISTAAAVRARLHELHVADSSVALDLSEVTFIDCGGLGSLIEALHSPAADSGMLWIAGGMSTAVRRLLELLSVAGFAPSFAP